jgi:elongation factor Ts
MAEITASMVRDLRDKTDAPMMECKKALVEAEGNSAKAEELLRVRLGNKASRVASRTAAEGVVAVYVARDAKTGAIVEVNCETDFVAQNEDFLKFASSLAEHVAKRNPPDAAALSSAPLGGSTVEQTRKALVGRMGENMSIRRFARIEAKGRIAHYVHGAKIGVLVDISGGDDQFAREIAQHISWAKPVALSKDGVPAESIKRERDIATAQAAASGKPPNIMEKMIEGGVQKYLKQVTLLGQGFVKDEKQSVAAVLKAKGASISSFVLYVMGEGIEKRSGNFAAEVMEQVSKAKKDEDKPEKAA